MSESNDDLYESAKEAVTKLFSDQSVSRRTCKENLETLISEIEVMIESLGGDEDEDIEWEGDDDHGSQTD